MAIVAHHFHKIELNSISWITFADWMNDAQKVFTASKNEAITMKKKNLERIIIINE